MNDAAIRFDQVTKRYTSRGRPALSALQLAVRRGEVLALVGASGSGKTTLLRLAAGLERPDSGTISLNGRVASNPGTWLPPERRRVGMVFQEGALFPHRTTAANIRYGMRGQTRAAQAARVAQLLALIGLEGYGYRYPHELSGGERQRVALARALAPEPELILLDEPFSNLDAHLRCSLRDDVCAILKELGTAAILVVHDPDDALNAGDRVAVLQEGHLVQAAPPRTVYHQPVSPYCAALFGPINTIARPGDTPRLVRPEQFRLLAEPAEDAVAATVVQMRDTGKHREVVVTCESAGPAGWRIYDRAHSALKPGDRIYVRWDAPQP